jgi:hypothetical protein
MGLLDGLFGKKKATDVQPFAADQNAPTSSKRANGKLRPIALIVVFKSPRSYTAAQLQTALRAMSPTLKAATVETDAKTIDQGTPASRVIWTDHIVDVVGFDLPLPSPVVENCVQAAHYSQEIKKAVRSHAAHATLFYGGSSSSVLEQYIALAVVGSAFVKLGGLAILNEAAMTSLPSNAVYELATKQTDFAVIRHMPLLMLFCGFVKYMLPDNQTMWARTYNNPAFSLPDFATKTVNSKAQQTFDMFSDFMAYLRSSRKSFKIGETAQFGPTKFRFHAPRDDEPFPTHTDGHLLIIEAV